MVHLGIVSKIHKIHLMIQMIHLIGGSYDDNRKRQEMLTRNKIRRGVDSCLLQRKCLNF